MWPISIRFSISISSQFWRSIQSLRQPTLWRLPTSWGKSISMSQFSLRPQASPSCFFVHDLTWMRRCKNSSPNLKPCVLQAWWILRKTVRRFRNSIRGCFRSRKLQDWLLLARSLCHYHHLLNLSISMENLLRGWPKRRSQSNKEKRNKRQIVDSRSP